MKQKVAFALIMGSITTALVSLTLVSVNKGFVAGFVVAWLKSWLISYIVAVPAILVVGPRVESSLNSWLGQKQIESQQVENS